jgi:SAM-dependent methyltransferase
MNSEPKSRFALVKSTSSIILSRAKQAYNREGLLYVLRSALIMILGYFIVYYYKMFKSSETFEFQGKTYRYFFHPYGTTWRNERTVAVPIIWDIVKEYEAKGKSILEVGNMLSYYFKVSHDILDKYEIKDGVINEDVVDFKPSKKYDLIVSILTLPEVGWYDMPRDPEKSVRAFENLKRLLAPGGQLVLVVGLGLNSQFEMSLKSKTLELNKPGYLIHTKGYRWKEPNWEDVKDAKYDKFVPTAHAILIGT